MTDDFEPAPVAEEPEPAPVPDFLELDGRKFTSQQLQPYVRFMDWAKANPAGFDDLEAWERGDKVMVSKDTPPVVTPSDDDDEFLSPALKERLTNLDQFQKDWYQEREAEKKAAIDAGVSRFSNAHGDLTPDEFQEVLKTARDNEMIRIQLSRNPHDKVAAVDTAMRQALLLAYPDRVEQKVHDKVVTEIAAKRKASAATGVSVSAPRVESEPEDPKEGLLNDIRAAMNEAN